MRGSQELRVKDANETHIERDARRTGADMCHVSMYICVRVYVRLDLDSPLKLFNLRPANKALALCSSLTDDFMRRGTHT